MSQRLIRKHPMTGCDVTPIWFDQNGIAVFPIMGSDSGDDDADGDDGDGDGADKSDTEGQGGDGDDGKGGTVTKEEFEALKARMSAADRRAAEAEKKVKEFEDSKKDEATKAAEKVAELTSANEALTKQVSDLRVENAFLSSNDIDWHDKDVALSHADLSEVLGEDGDVNKKALKKALEDLAKAKPFLVKTKDGGGDKQDLPNGTTGGTVGSGGTKKKDGLSDEELKRKYPALYA